MPKNWLQRELESAAAEVATWPEGMRAHMYGGPKSSDKALLGGIRKLEKRLKEMRAEARERGLIK